MFIEAIDGKVGIASIMKLLMIELIANYFYVHIVVGWRGLLKCKRSRDRFRGEIVSFIDCSTSLALQHFIIQSFTAFYSSLQSFTVAN